jgi:uncharacterized protein YdaU (DUF1376 family)
MAKPPAVQFYSGDFLTGTTLMTNEEVGLYIRLLCLQAENGSVPDDPERMSAVYGPSVLKVWPAVRAKFITGNEAGTMVNEKMSKVLADREAFRLKQSEKGKASAEARLTSGSTKKEPRFNHGSTTVEPLGGRGRDRLLVQEGKERAIKTPFDNWWSIYRKGSRKLSAEQWEKMPEDDRVACIAKTPAYIASKPDPLYRKDGERFLKHRTWEDAIVTSKTTATDQRRSTVSDRDKPITIGQRQIPS